MVRTYKYRLHPTSAQEAVLAITLDKLRELYNAALQERRDAYKKCGVSVNYYQQCAQLKYIRVDREDIRKINCSVEQNIIERRGRRLRREGALVPSETREDSF